MKKKFLLAMALISLLFIGCSEQTKEEAKEVSNNTIDKVAEVSEKTVDKTSQLVENVKKEVEPVIETVVEKSKEVVESSKEMITKVADSTVQAKDDIKQKIHTATAPSIDGKALYAKCVACHGANAEKKALNTSKVIKGWQSKQIAEALLGYKNGTYGGAMKSIMQGQVSKLNKDEIQALASYIETL